MNEIINLRIVPPDAARERLETNVIKLSNIVANLEKGELIYETPAKDNLPADNERLAQVDAAFEYLLRKGVLRTSKFCYSACVASVFVGVATGAAITFMLLKSF